LTLTYGNGQTLHYTTTFTITQQQLTQVFSSSKTQAPGSPGSSTSSMLPWLILIAVLVLLLIGGNIIFWKFVLARNNGNNNKPPTRPNSSQFKRPGTFQGKKKVLL
jgi:hypothetical protein